MPVLFPTAAWESTIISKEKAELQFFFFLISTDGLLTLARQVHRPSETSTSMSAIGLRGTSQTQARRNPSPSEHSGRPGVGGCVLRLPGELVHFPSCCAAHPPAAMKETGCLVVASAASGSLEGGAALMGWRPTPEGLAQTRAFCRQLAV